MSVKRLLYTLIFIKRDNEVLLGYKTRGLGADLWNGFGGKVDPNETIAECAARELKEESNLEANLDHVGVIRYYEEDKPIEQIVHVFTSGEFRGKIIESEEMSPIKWFECRQMPFDKMWPDASSWIPAMLKNEFFSVNVTYGCDNTIKKIEMNLFGQRNKFKNYINSH